MNAYAIAHIPMTPRMDNNVMVPSLPVIDIVLDVSSSIEAVTWIAVALVEVELLYSMD